VAVAVSAVTQAKVAEAEMESAAEDVSSTEEKNNPPTVAANGVSARAASPKIIEPFQAWLLQALALGGWPAHEWLGSCRPLQHRGVYPNTA